MPESVLILYDRCRLNLALPLYFEEMPLEKIRKVFKLLKDRTWQNDAAWETLDQFFPAWEQELKQRLDSTEQRLLIAKQDAEAKRRTMEAMGSALETNITQAKIWLQHAKKQLKRLSKTPSAERGKAERRVEAYENDLKNAMRPKTDYQNAVKEVKRLENAVKATKTAIVRGSKIISEYKALKA